MEIDLATEHPTKLLIHVDEILEQIISDFEDYLSMNKFTDVDEDKNNHERWIVDLRSAQTHIKNVIK